MYVQVIPHSLRYLFNKTLLLVPETPPHGMEAIQFNRTSVFLKWQPPFPNRTRNGKFSVNMYIFLLQVLAESLTEEILIEMFGFKKQQKSRIHFINFKVQDCNFSFNFIKVKLFPFANNFYVASANFV